MFFKAPRLIFYMHPQFLNRFLFDGYCLPRFFSARKLFFWWYSKCGEKLHHHHSSRERFKTGKKIFQNTIHFQLLSQSVQGCLSPSRRGCQSGKLFSGRKYSATRGCPIHNGSFGIGASQATGRWQQAHSHTWHRSGTRWMALGGCRLQVQWYSTSHTYGQQKIALPNLDIQQNVSKIGC